MDTDHIIIIDCSGSMGASQGGKTLHEIACEQMRSIQGRQPGKYLIIAFSSDVVPCLTGEPPFLGLGTDMAAALAYVREFDDTGITFTLISDGMPDDTNATLNVARLFKSKINTVYVGPDDTNAIKFLQMLANSTGGKSARGKVSDIDDITTKLLAASNTSTSNSATQL
jgi:hypothetical protein